MKYLIYLLIIVVILTILFLLFGIVKPKITYKCEVVVNKPVWEASNIAQDESRMGEWLDGFIKIEHISGTPKTAGNISNVYFKMNGQDIKVKRTITAVKLFESMESFSETDFMNMEYSVKMIDQGEKTKISSITTVKGNGIFSRSLMAFMGNSLKKQEEKNLSNLKSTIEANTKQYQQN
jgi:hypothetical protein